MAAQTVTCETPRYVLHEDRQPIGPNVVPHSQGSGCLAIYGFSGKPAYDAFIAASQGDLRPYPLMKGYLRNRLVEEHETTCVVIVDAAGPVDVGVDAATMENVLAAQDKAAPQLASDFHLTFCPTRQAYTMDEVTE